LKLKLGVMIGGFVLLIVGILVLLVSAIWALVSFLFASNVEAPLVAFIAGLVIIGVGIADIVGGVRGFRILSGNTSPIDVQRRKTG
jgi:uncharacterized integral membrane protein